MVQSRDRRGGSGSSAYRNLKPIGAEDLSRFVDTGNRLALCCRLTRQTDERRVRVVTELTWLSRRSRLSARVVRPIKKIPMKSIFLIIFVAMAVGCSNSAHEAKIENASKVVKFGYEFFNGINVQPLSEEVTPTENAHVEGQIDEWRSAKFDGFTFRYYRVVREKRNMLTHLELTTPTVMAPFGLHVGSSEAEILNALGTPSSIDKGIFVYERGDGYSETVAFAFSKGLVSAINWQYEID